MLPVVLSTAAELDLADIWDHIAQDNRPAANRILDLIQARLQSIARFPKIGAAYPEVADDLRCYWVGNYAIFYRLRPTAVEIARVLHGARDIPSLIRE
jgi:toxin ParE1/3/4